MDPHGLRLMCAQQGGWLMAQDQDDCQSQGPTWGWAGHSQSEGDMTGVSWGRGPGQAGASCCLPTRVTVMWYQGAWSHFLH